MQGAGRVILTASSRTQFAMEMARGEITGEPQASVFTRYLVEGLRTGHADIDRDGRITVDKLYDWTERRMREDGHRQTPRKVVMSQEGRLLLATVPQRMLRPLPLPEQVQALLTSEVVGARLGGVIELDQWLTGDHAGQRLAARTELERLAASDDSARVREAASRVLRRPAEEERQRREATEATRLAEEERQRREIRRKISATAPTPSSAAGSIRASGRPEASPTCVSTPTVIVIALTSGPRAATMARPVPIRSPIRLALLGRDGALSELVEGGRGVSTLALSITAIIS